MMEEHQSQGSTLLIQLGISFFKKEKKEIKPFKFNVQSLGKLLLASINNAKETLDEY